MGCVANGRMGGNRMLGTIASVFVRRMLFGRAGVGIVLGLLALQLTVFWLSLGPLDQVSAFCAGPNGKLVATIFGVVHLALLVLLGLGVFAIRLPVLRLPYTILLFTCLSALPVQAHLVSTGALQCDAP